MHHCHATGCKKSVSPDLWGCSKHWFMIPKKLRERIWGTYRPGQETDKRPSLEYLKAAREAVIYVAKKEGIKPNTSVYDAFLAIHRITKEIIRKAPTHRARYQLTDKVFHYYPFHDGFKCLSLCKKRVDIVNLLDSIAEKGKKPASKDCPECWRILNKKRKKDGEKIPVRRGFSNLRKSRKDDR